MFERGSSFNSINPENREEAAEYRVEVASEAELNSLNSTFPPPEDDPEQHKTLLEQQAKGEAKFFVLQKEDEVTGTAGLLYDWQSPEYSDIKGPHVMGVQIAEEHRGKYLPDKLLQACEKEAKSKGFSEIYTGVYADNEPAIKAYRRNGFEEIPGTKHTLPEEIDPDQIPSFYMKKSLG